MKEVLKSQSEIEDEKSDQVEPKINGNNGKNRKTVITPNYRFYGLIFRHYLKSRKPKIIKTPYK